MPKPRKAKKPKPYQAELEAFCESRGFPKPVTEYKFHPVRRWRFDFAFPDWLIAIEVDGGVFIQGGHTRGKGYENDREKDGEATAMGWRVLRVSTGQLKKGLCFPWLEKLFRKSE